MLPVRIFPRPSLLTGAVVVSSVAAGLAAGVLAGGALVLAAAMGRRS